MNNVCCKNGPGYSNPIEAMQNGPREKILYIQCPSSKIDKPDYLATVDANPDSPNYSKIIHRLKMPYIGDELHHSGWNSCSSCFGKPDKKRSHLILPSLNSDRIYVIDVHTNPLNPKIHKIIEPDELHEKTGCTMPHTSHCLADGNIMISTLGDLKGNSAGRFITINSETWNLNGVWSKDVAEMGYDFWYQPRHNVMISSQWGPPNLIKGGFNLEHVMQNKYGHKLTIWDWSERKIIQSIDLGEEGLMPLELRFLHDPDSCEAFVGCALSSNVFRIFKNKSEIWEAEKIIDVPSIDVNNFALPSMPGLITDILISLDDKYLYFSNWLQGDIRQYDISNRSAPVLVGQVYINGSMFKGGSVTPKKDVDINKQPEPLIINGKKVSGGPQMIQLSLDGKRLYVTTSLYSIWDKQFYPNMIEHGSFLLKIDVDNEKGGLHLDSNFHIDFGAEPDGPVLAHEVRYPGGDCSSDIWI